MDRSEMNTTGGPEEKEKEWGISDRGPFQF